MQTLGPVVTALAQVLQDAPGMGQAAPKALDSLAPIPDRPIGGAECAPLQLHDMRQQLRADRHGHLGGSRWRRGSAVGDEVDQGRVGFVADRRDDRDLGGRDGARHHFFIEGPEVFQ